MSIKYSFVSELVNDFRNDDIKNVINHFEYIKRYQTSKEVASLANQLYYDVYSMSLNTTIKHLKLIIPKDVIKDKIKKFPELLEYFI